MRAEGTRRVPRIGHVSVRRAYFGHAAQKSFRVDGSNGRSTLGPPSSCTMSSQVLLT